MEHGLGQQVADGGELFGRGAGRQDALSMGGQALHDLGDLGGGLAGAVDDFGLAGAHGPVRVQPGELGDAVRDAVVGQRPQGVQSGVNADAAALHIAQQGGQAFSVHAPCPSVGVQAAALVAGQFHGDIGVAEGLEFVADLLPQVRVKQPVHLRRVHFQAGDGVVVADAHLPEAQVVPQEVLGGVQTTPAVRR